MILLENFLRKLYLVLRPLIKWFLHRFTNLCELQVSMSFSMNRNEKSIFFSFLDPSDSVTELILVLNDASW